MIMYSVTTKITIFCKNLEPYSKILFTFIKFNNFKFKACLYCLNGLIVSIALYQWINSHYLKECYCKVVYLRSQP